MLQNKKLLATIILFIATVLLIGFGVVAPHINNHRTIQVTTTTTPITFELNDQSYTLTSKLQKFSVKPGVYNYRAIGTVEGKRVVITDKLDVTQDKQASVRLDLSIYTKDAISKALCSVAATDDGCAFTPDVFSVSYVEQYQWAVIRINSPQVGLGEAVMHVENGLWVVDDGPGTDIPSDGYYPQTVEEALNNARQQ